MKVSWVHLEELFVQSEGCPNHYTLLLLIARVPQVPQVHLRAWRGTLRFGGVVDKANLWLFHPRWQG